jgi:hypothetical protein
LVTDRDAGPGRTKNNGRMAQNINNSRTLQIQCMSKNKSIRPIRVGLLPNTVAHLLYKTVTFSPLRPQVIKKYLTTLLFCTACANFLSNPRRIHSGKKDKEKEEYGFVVCCYLLWAAPLLLSVRFCALCVCIRIRDLLERIRIRIILFTR